MCKMLFTYPPVHFKTAHQVFFRRHDPYLLHTKKRVQVCAADHRQQLDLDLGCRTPKGWLFHLLTGPFRKTEISTSRLVPPGAAKRAPSGRRRESGLRMTFRAKKPAAPTALGTDVASNQTKRVKGPMGGSSNPLSI